MTNTAERIDDGERNNSFPIVGVGASAGGLEAFLPLFRGLVHPTGMAFVLVTHLEPNHESQLVEIVSSATTLKVVPVHDKQRVEADHIYILPPNEEVVIQGGELKLSPRSASASPHYPIDHFFTSLADDQGVRAIGIILSGGGSDGALGLRAIKARCGTTFAQDLSARHAGMPRSAIATGSVDLVLPPARIIEELQRIRSHPYLAQSLTKEESQETSSEEALFEKTSSPRNEKDYSRILSLVKESQAVDFSHYKPSTIARRIGRRMLLHNLTTFNEYAALLEKEPSERFHLYQDILICVTSFFREPEVFDALREVISESLKGGAREVFRVWVTGCATGEEAYSLAILLTEIAETNGVQVPYQVFATDISDSAIDRARNGIFPEAVQTQLTPERLRRFFTRVDAGYRIADNIRQNCIFARHDLTADPPFSQMDLISCRNVLIYLGAPIQERILPTLHYGIKPGGLLVLGSAETVGGRSDLFEPSDKKHNIFRKRDVPSKLVIGTAGEIAIPSLRDDVQAALTPNIVPFVDVDSRSARILRDLYAPPAVLIDGQMQVLHFHGQTNFYLETAKGEASLNLLRLATESLLFPLRSIVERVIETKEPAHETGVRVEHDGQVREIALRVIPVDDGSPCYLVLFEEEHRSTAAAENAVISSGDKPTETLQLQLSQAEREISRMRDYLRRLMEQHEAANEELRAANEEARSSNEELQSTNEELRTAKEELQSSNEELSTVNDELKHRNEELRTSSNDLSNILSATMIPIFMVDMELRLRRFTPAAERVLRFTASDIGQDITKLPLSFDVPNLREMLTATIQTLEVGQTRGQDRPGRFYDVVVRPYRTVDHRIDGAVVSFQDIDDLTRALAETEVARKFAEGIVETVQHPLLILDANLRILRATDAFFATFQVSREETVGQLIGEIGTGQWKFPELQRLLEAALIRDVPFRDLEMENDFPRIGRRTMRLNARRITSRDNQPHRLMLAIEDVTDRKETAEIQYRRLFESARDAILILEALSGRVVDCNPYFTELTRYKRQDIVGEPFWNLELFATAEEAGKLVPETRIRQTSRYDSVRVRAKDGRRLILEIIGNQYRVKDKDFIQVNIRDVTERREMEERLRRSNLDLEQFAFAASHDLQEPLRTIRTFSQLVTQRNEGKLGTETDEQLKFIVSAADRISHMVLDLLSYSQIVRAETKPALVSSEAVLSSVILNLHADSPRFRSPILL